MPPAGTVVAAAQSNVGQMATDGTTLFWVTAGTAPGFNDGKVLSCPVAGCPDAGPTVLAENQKKPEFVSLSDENYNAKAGPEANKYVFWTTTLGGEVLRCEKTGCGGAGPTVLASKQNAPAGVRATTSLPKSNSAAELVVLWAETGTGRILTCPDEGCGEKSPAVIVEGRASPRQVSSGNSFIYWMEEGGNANSAALYKYRKLQPAPPAVEGPRDQTGALANAGRFDLVNGNLFAVDRGTVANQFADGKILWADPSVATDEPKATYVEGQKNLFGIAGDGNGVFWNADDKLVTCAFGQTCAAPQILAEGGVGSSELALDATSIYFFVGDTIRKLPRPAPPAVVAPRPPVSD